ncbi:hypothetical protein BpHYR1_042494 [Brachionus plicatilis]|uniref:Uncharacterized protein n=1 Tax=Brachionus plicatilis TaxID=10195 RepID=A0A3M7SX33_BRAPC|nr:hypothetical protein BpHYR1_042494 [Brachionus plicatilis]
MRINVHCIDQLDKTHLLIIFFNKFLLDSSEWIWPSYQPYDKNYKESRRSRKNGRDLIKK